MNPSRHWRNALLALTLIVVWGASAWLQADVDRQLSSRAPDETLWISSPKAVRLLSMGHQGLLADIYWTRAVQYYGSRRRDHKTDFHLLAPLLDITTTLDPKLIVAYNFGAAFLSEPSPRGAADPEKAIALLQKGLAANPEHWRFWHELGFIYYWDLQDYAKAAAAYEEGAKNPEARDWMKVMAASIRAKGGDRDTSLFLWREIYNSSEDKTIRDNALNHIKALQAQKEMAAIEELAQRFQRVRGRFPASIQELVASGLLRAQPRDPTGEPYRLHPDGKAALDPKSMLNVVINSSPSPPPR